MNTGLLLFIGLASVVFLCSTSGFAAGPIQLPDPQTDGGKPLMTALKDRMSTRAFSPESLSMQTLSNLLWAAFGVSRADGRRTAPSARNWQEIDIYVAKADGLFLWDAGKNTLQQILSEDIRALTGTQAYVKDAAVNLVLVADLSKATGGGWDQNSEIAADSAFICENVYLFCSSEGLATVVRALIDRSALARAMKLRPDQRITLSQSVGYPKKQQ